MFTVPVIVPNLTPVKLKKNTKNIMEGKLSLQQITEKYENISAKDLKYVERDLTIRDKVTKNFKILFGLK